MTPLVHDSLDQSKAARAGAQTAATLQQLGREAVSPSGQRTRSISGNKETVPPIVMAQLLASRPQPLREHLRHAAPGPVARRHQQGRLLFYPV
jgi:hypothetical protein